MGHHHYFILWLITVPLLISFPSAIAADRPWGNYVPPEKGEITGNEQKRGYIGRYNPWQRVKPKPVEEKEKEKKEEKEVDEVDDSNKRDLRQGRTFTGKGNPLVWPSDLEKKGYNSSKNRPLSPYPPRIDEDGLRGETPSFYLPRPDYLDYNKGLGW